MSQVMECPKCGVKAYELVNLFLAADRINEFGRREITYTAIHKDNINYGDDHRFHCGNCGGTFTLNEMVQKKA